MAAAKNFLYDVARGVPIGDLIVLGGGAALQSALIAAFEAVTGKEIVVPEHTEIMGAYGAALLGLEEHNHKKAAGSVVKNTFRGLDASFLPDKTEQVTCRGCGNSCNTTVSTVQSPDGTVEMHASGTGCGNPAIEGIKKEPSKGTKLPNHVRMRKQLLEKSQAGVATVSLDVAECARCDGERVRETRSWRLDRAEHDQDGRGVKVGIPATGLTTTKAPFGAFRRLVATVAGPVARRDERPDGEIFDRTAKHLQRHGHAVHGGRGAPARERKCHTCPHAEDDRAAPLAGAEEIKGKPRCVHCLSSGPFQAQSGPLGAKAKRPRRRSSHPRSTQRLGRANSEGDDHARKVLGVESRR